MRRVQWERAGYDRYVQTATVAGREIVVRPREPERAAWLAIVDWAGTSWHAVVTSERQAKKLAVGMALALGDEREGG